MTTVVNNPATSTDSGNNFTLVFAMIFLIGFVVLFLVFGIPILRETFIPDRSNNSQTGSQTPQINVPDKIDVNINQEP